LASYFVLNQPGPQFATGNDDIEVALGKMAFLGSKQRVKGNRRRLDRKAERECWVVPPALISSKVKALLIRPRELSRTLPGRLLMMSPKHSPAQPLSMGA
jgi:hypothetical protein